MNPFASATTMLSALQARQISAAELLELHLRRIERYNPTLNAIVISDFDHARQTAAAADMKRARGEDGPLLGLPLTIKDAIDVLGMPCTSGDPHQADRRPEADAPVAARVRAAGAVIMGKTNLSLWTCGWHAENPLFGRTNNPWDLERTPGGSTGGGAAALAAGLTPLEFGSDAAGSVRVPAAFCGIYGHKPSYTAVPRSGHFPGSPWPNPAAVIFVQGPMARSAEDLELALDVISGPEVGEDVAWRLELPPARHEQLCDYRVAVLEPLDGLPMDDEIIEALERLAQGLDRAGARVHRVRAEEILGDLNRYYQLYYSMVYAVLNNAFHRTAPEELRKDAEVLRALGQRIHGGRYDLTRGLVGVAVDYIDWHDQREQYRAAYRRLFRDWDILLAPITTVPTVPHSLAKEAQHLQYPVLANLAGQPATAFPVGLTRDGLPIGLQAIGPYLEDRTLLRFAALVAREWGGYRPPPGYGGDG
jgi:amidase